MRGAPNAKSPDLAHWVILVGGVVYGLGVGLLALGVYVELPGFLDAYGDPRAGWPIAVNLIALLLSYGTWRWVNRRNTRPFAVVLLALGIATVLVLAFSAYYACPEPGLSSGWSAFTRVVGLVTNNYATEMFTDPVPGCDTGGVPLALQFARLVQLVVVLVAATSAVTALLRSQVDRVAVRWSPRVSLALGVDDESVGLLPGLASSRAGDALVVLTRDPLASWVAAARAAGWRVITGEVSDTYLLRRLLTRYRRRHALRDLYVFSRPDVSASTQVYRVLGLLEGWSATDPIRVLIRSDNRWHAENIRSKMTMAGSSVIVDTISKFDAVAQELLDDITDRGCDLLVLHGQSEFTPALLEQVAQQERERALFETAAHLDVVVVGPTAEDVVAEHRAAAAYYGRAPVETRVDPRTDLHTVMTELCGAHAAPALVFTNDPSIEDQRRAAVLATSLPRCQVYVHYTDVAGLETTPMVSNARAYGATLVTAYPTVGRWERLARLSHEAYLAAYPDAKDPARKSWAELNGFYKQSNIRQMTTVVTSMSSVGRAWGAAPSIVEPVAAEQLEEMARIEHESWFHFMRSHGWRYGSHRDHRRRRHPALVPWDELDEASRVKTRKGITDSLTLLATLGYRSFNNPHATWVRFQRRGEVTAVRRDEPWSWTTSDGHTMRGQAGDWEVTGDDGAARSVDAAIFEQTHEQVDGDRWRRVGEVRGRQAYPGEVVHSLEGDLTAGLGQWVLRGVAGEEWLVSTEHLESMYDRLDA